MDILSPEFFRDIWRTRPLHVPGGATQIVDFRWTDDEFDAMLPVARREAPDDVKERPGEVEFVANLDRFVPAARRRAVELEPVLGTGSLWFDSVRTFGPGSIGCHFDNSDNFVLQREGTKRWRLWPAEVVPAEIRHQRMLGVPGIGALEPPAAGCHEYVLEPGDLLYIPLMWPHWGVSDGASLSLSLASNAVPAIDEVLWLTRTVLHRLRGGAAPLPALAGDAAMRDRAIAEVRRVAEDIAARLAVPEVAETVARAWAVQRGGGA